MTHSFDIVRDPWIRVKFNTGVIKEVGVREAIKESHNIIEVVEPNDKYSYGILNLLTAFVASVYDLSDIEAKADILFSNQFDITLFDKYIEDCETKRSNCFNLFGENPFYQNVYAKYNLKNGNKLTKEEIEKVPLKDAAMIGKVALDVPSGNNTTHFVNDILIGKWLDFAEVTKALISYTHFQAGQDGPNSANGVNGGMNYPEYITFRGKNLFHIILLNTITEETWHNELGDDIPYKGNAAWEMEAGLIPKEEVTSVSMVEGLTFQNRYVLLDSPNYEKKIGYVYFGPGRVFATNKDKSAKSLWRQPNAAYTPIYSKGKEVGFGPLMMKSAYDLWNDMGDFFSLTSSGNNNRLPKTVVEYRSLFEKYRGKMEGLGYSSKILPYRVYYICVDGGQYPPKACGTYENYFPLILMEHPNVLDDFNNLIKNASSVGKLLKSEVFKLSDSMDSIKKAEWYKRLSEQYYNRMSMEFIPELLEEIYNISDSEDFEEDFYDIYNAFKVKVKDLAIKTFTDYVLNGQSKVLEVYEDEKTKEKIYKGFYGIVNSNIKYIRGSINKIMGIEKKEESDNNE